MWIDLKDSPELEQLDDFQARVRARISRYGRILRTDRRRGTTRSALRMLRRLNRVDELVALDAWLRLCRDTVTHFPGRVWRPLA